MKDFKLVESDKVFAGVCTGLKRVTGISILNWRIIFVVASVTCYVGIVAYAALFLYAKFNEQ